MSLGDGAEEDRLNRDNTDGEGREGKRGTIEESTRRRGRGASGSSILVRFEAPNEVYATDEGEL